MFIDTWQNKEKFKGEASHAESGTRDLRARRKILPKVRTTTGRFI